MVYNSKTGPIGSQPNTEQYQESDHHEEIIEMNEDELMEAEEEFQSFLNQNSSVHIVNEAQMARAFDLPAAPEGYRYDMTKNPPELVKKKVRKTKAKAPKSE